LTASVPYLTPENQLVLLDWVLKKSGDGDLLNAIAPHVDSVHQKKIMDYFSDGLWALEKKMILKKDLDAGKTLFMMLYSGFQDIDMDPRKESLQGLSSFLGPKVNHFQFMHDEQQQTVEELILKFFLDNAVDIYLNSPAVLPKVGKLSLFDSSCSAAASVDEQSAVNTP
jgi:hypothetical protein